MRLAGCARACIAKLSRKQQHEYKGGKNVCDTPKEDLVPCLQISICWVIISTVLWDTQQIRAQEALSPPVSILTKLPIVAHNLILTQCWKVGGWRLRSFSYLHMAHLDITFKLVKVNNYVNESPEKSVPCIHHIKNMLERTERTLNHMAT